MKSIFILFAFSLVITTSSSDDLSAVDLSEALENNFVTMKASGNEESTHYYQPLVLSLKNVKNEPVEIALKAGQLFTSTDPTVQDIIVTKDEMITLAPGEMLDKPIYGMCIQEFNSGPGNSDTYKLGGIAEGNLATLVNRIQKEETFGIAAQQAIWSLTDARPVEAIESVNLNETENVRNLVWDLVSTDTVLVQRQIRRREASQYIKRSMKGSFKYRISKESAVTIGLFNDQNIVMEELFNDPQVATGQHEFDYAFDSMIDPTKHYYIRLIIDGQVEINFDMKPRGS